MHKHLYYKISYSKQPKGPKGKRRERKVSYQWRMQFILSFGRSSNTGIVVVSVQLREQPEAFDLGIGCSRVAWIEYWVEVP